MVNDIIINTSLKLQTGVKEKIHLLMNDAFDDCEMEQNSFLSDVASFP